jgi:malonate transporter and related proteins
MEMLEAFGKLFPVALIFIAGIFFAKRNLIAANNSKAFADFAFLLAIPCYLFRNIYRSDLHTLFNWQAMLAYAVSAAICVLLVGFLAFRTTGGNARRIALNLMAGIQVNTAYFAIPVFIMLFGNATPIFPVLLFQVCTLSVVVIAIMEFGIADQDKGWLAKLATSVWASLNTPMVIACIVAIIFNLVSLKVPHIILDSFGFIGDSASPIALFALGLHLGGSKNLMKKTNSEEVGLLIFKSAIFPLVTLLICKYVFAIDKVWLSYLVLIAAMPTPQNLFVFAQRYNVAVDMAASIVVKSSIVALLLLPIWIKIVHAG